MLSLVPSIAPFWTFEFSHPVVALRLARTRHGGLSRWAILHAGRPLLIEPPCSPHSDPSGKSVVCHPHHADAANAPSCIVAFFSILQAGPKTSFGASGWRGGAGRTQPHTPKTAIPRCQRLLQ